MSLMKRLDALGRRRVPAVVVDFLLAGLILAGTSAIPAEVTTSPGIREPDVWRNLFVVLFSVPLAVHRKKPGLVLAVMGASLAALQGLHYIPGPVGPRGAAVGVPYVALAVAVFLTALRSTRRGAAFVIAIMIPGAIVAEALMSQGHRIAAALTIVVLLVAAWSLGRLYKARKGMEHEAVQRAAAVERERAANARAAVAQERARIARELHDIVAHNVSLMVVQTIAADRIQDRDGAKAHELHRSIEQVGRTAVSELRGLLQVLRTEDVDEESPTQPPQPTLDEIPSLVEAVRATGLDVRLTTTGPPVPVPAVSQLAVYRIIQEALTNTLKHAGRTRVALGLSWESDQLTVTVCDSGRQADERFVAAALPGGAGHGLIGMRERITAVGGALYTGERPGGGFCVHATIPLPVVESPEGNARHDHDSRTAGR